MAKRMSIRTLTNTAKEAQAAALTSRDLFQKIAVAAIDYALPEAVGGDGNVDPANIIMGHMPDTGMRREAMLVFLRDHAPIQWSEKDGKFKYSKGRAKAEDWQKLENGVTWYEYSNVGNNTAQYDAIRDLKGAIKALEKKRILANENGEEHLSKVYFDCEQAMQKELDALTANKAEKANTKGKESTQSIKEAAE